MSAQILDGKILAVQLKQSLKKQVSALKSKTGHSPRLVSIIVGNDPGTVSYVSSQQKTAESLGIHYTLEIFKSTVMKEQFLGAIQGFNKDKDVHGIIVNKPLPQHLDFDTVIRAIAPVKNVEQMCLCTPVGAMALLKSSGIDLTGKEAVVIGRSQIVGKPLAMMLLDEHCTVTVCHSKTMDLPAHVRRADIVAAAIGKPKFVKGEWIKPGAIVIDVGVNQADGKIVGDVDFDAVKQKAGYITPVPGGVGPVTSVMLMKNVVEAFKQQASG